MRKLASIRRITDVIPIEGADFIELVQVDGWQCVAKKGEFKVDDQCVYFEIDSWLPIEERFEFLRKTSYHKNELGEGFRLKPIKMKGHKSQGLALPLKMFPEIPKNIAYRTDVADLLKVIKFQYYQPAIMGGTAKGSFPAYIPKTDAERIQNLMEYFRIHKNTVWEVTEKIDGTSCTMYHIDGEVGVCSRNRELLLEHEDNQSNLYVKTALESGILDALKHLKKNIAVQGEIVGSNIAGHKKNHYNYTDQKLFIFNIWDIKKGVYLNTNERCIVLDAIEAFHNDKKQVNHVPLLGQEKIFKEVTTIEDLLKFVEGKSKLNKQVEREGLVFKMLTNPAINFKAVSDTYLYGDK